MFKVEKAVNTHSEDIAKFNFRYDEHAPKILGFINQYTNTKEQAEQYLETVFASIWDNIKIFDGDINKKIIRIVLSICRPLIKKAAEPLKVVKKT